MHPLHPLIDLADKRGRLRAAWLNNILTLATATLALLVALRPSGHLPAVQRYSLTACWVLLGLGILFGAAATYGEVAMAKRLAESFKNKMLETAEKTGSFIVTDPVLVKPHWIWSFCASAMCVCLLLAVVSLVTYATLTTLQN